MTALVVYESMYGNTRAIAEAIAEGLHACHPVRVVAAAEVTVPELTEATLVVMGGPTHVHGMSSPRTRRAAIEAAAKTSTPLEPTATADGVRELLDRCATIRGVPAAAFDTRMPGWSVLTGRAARDIARRLRRHGFRVIVPPESFIVDRQNHVMPGELARARTWGGSLATAVAVRSAPTVPKQHAA